MDFRASSPNRWSGLAKPGEQKVWKTPARPVRHYIGKDDLRNLLVGGAISNFVFAAVVNE
jgi:hypothetical protein